MCLQLYGCLHLLVYRLSFYLVQKQLSVEFAFRVALLLCIYRNWKNHDGCCRPDSLQSVVLCNGMTVVSSNSLTMQYKYRDRNVTTESEVVFDIKFIVPVTWLAWPAISYQSMRIMQREYFSRCSVYIVFFRRFENACNGINQVRQVCLRLYLCMNRLEKNNAVAFAQIDTSRSRFLLVIENKVHARTRVRSSCYCMPIFKNR